MGKKLYRISNAESEMQHYLNLTESEGKLLLWLSKCGYTDYHTEIEELEELPNVMEF